MFGTSRRYTADLMRGGLIREGRHGTAALQWTSTEAANLLIALASGAALVTLAANVRAIRELPVLGSISEDYGDLDGMTWPSATTFGPALDALIDDHRTGQFAQFRAGGKLDYAMIGVDFVNGGRRAALRVLGHRLDCTRAYGAELDPAACLTVERKIQSNIFPNQTPIFERLAEALNSP
jgi:hypothetical protein